MLTTLRRTRMTSALIALLSLLFMQLAVASYVCPGAATKLVEAAAMAQSGMPCAGAATMNMDDAQPNLCQAHCQAGEQSADTYQLPPLLAVAAVLAVFPASTTPLVDWGLTTLQAPLLRRCTAPTLAVRCCCFRI